MTKPTSPTTPAQRRAVDLLRAYGHVFPARRGRYAAIGDVTTEVSPQMARWLIASGWAAWKRKSPVHVPYLTIVHRDTHQTYDAATDPLNAFVTHCTCGHTTRGMDPDDADAKMLDHTNPEN